MPSFTVQYQSYEHMCLEQLLCYYAAVYVPIPLKHNHKRKLVNEPMKTDCLPVNYLFLCWETSVYKEI